MRTLRLAVLALLALALLAAGCSSSNDSESANYVAFEDDVVPTAPAGQAGGNQATGNEASIDQTGSDQGTAAAAAVQSNADAAPADELDIIVGAFDQFLSLRAQAITGEIAIEELGAVATPQAIAQVAQLRSANDALIAQDSYAVLSELAEWSNVTMVAQTEDRLLFTDCTERQFVTPGGATVVRFVTNDVTMIEDDGAYVVDTVIETQDGIVALGPDEFGCVPPSFAERATQTADLAVREAARLIADPRTALASELPAVFAGDARASLNQVLQTLNSDGLARVNDEEVNLRVVGMDVNASEFTVIVSVCRTYPQGRTLVGTDGEVLTTDLPIGSSYEEWLHVQLEPVPAGAQSNDITTVVEDRGPNCQEG